VKVKVEKYPGLCIGNNGNLKFSGADCVRLAKTFGTPLYVISEDIFRDMCRTQRAAFEKHCPNAHISFSTKALPVVALMRVAVQEGLGLDASSPGELFGALKAGCKPENTILHGNFKKQEDLAFALEHKVGRIVIDSFEEIEILDKVARKLKVKARVQVRVNPGVEAHTFELLKVGMLDSKFGLPLENGDALEAVRRIMKKKNLDFMGVHYHIGSQILDPVPFRVAAERAMNFLHVLHRDLNATVRELNIGGGLPVRYDSQHPMPTPAQFASQVCGTVKQMTKDFGLDVPRIILEPGRSVAGPAGITLYTVGPVKHIPGIRDYVTVDGGLSDNVRPGLYGATYDGLLANKAQAKGRMKSFRVCGRHCETDTLFQALPLPDPQYGDILAVLSTGAYNYAMSSNYNKFPRPAMVAVSKGKARLIMERETYADLYKKDVPEGSD
jgi:diaminopimelate decarboxylase